MKHRLIWIFGIALVVLGGCGREEEANLAAARKMYDRLQIGMSHNDACWYAGTTCHEDHLEYHYSIDVGKSFSKKEFMLILFIREGKFARAQIIKPRYQGGTRQGDAGEVVAEKGA